MKTLAIATLAAIVTTSAVMAQTTTPAKPQIDPSAIEAKKAQCLATAYHKWLPPHKAGDISPSGTPYLRNSNGQCRLDGKKVKAAILTGAIKAPN